MKPKYSYILLFLSSIYVYSSDPEYSPTDSEIEEETKSIQQRVLDLKRDACWNGSAIPAFIEDAKRKLGDYGAQNTPRAVIAFDIAQQHVNDLKKQLLDAKFSENAAQSEKLAEELKLAITEAKSAQNNAQSAIVERLKRKKSETVENFQSKQMSQKELRALRLAREAANQKT